MAKKGGKKNKSKAKGAAGGGAVKVPDAKNVIQKEEEKLEGAASDTSTTEPTPATASGSAAAAPPDTVATAAPLATTEVPDPTAQAIAAVPEEKEKEEKEFPKQATEQVPTDAKKEQRGDAGTQALAAVAPTSSKEQVAEQAKKQQEAPKETTTTPATSDRADLLTDTSKKAEQVVSPEATSGVSKGVSEAAKKEQIPSEVVAGAAASAEKPPKQDKTQAAPAGLEKTSAVKEAQAKPAAEVADAEHKATVEEESTGATPVATAAPLVAPHVKRSHEVPAFVTQDGDLPPKKARVDETAEAATAQSKLDIPGRFPTPSVAGSTASGADSGIATETQDALKKDTAANKSGVAGTTAAPQPAVSQPTEPAVSAPAAKAVAAKDTSQPTAADKTAPAGTGAEAVSEKQAVPPTKSENGDTTARPINPAAGAKGAGAEAESAPQPSAVTSQQPQVQQTLDKAAPKQAQPEPAKKGGFVAWIKRKFRGEKKATA